MKVYGLLSRVRQALTSAVVRLEDTKRFTVFADHFAANSPNPSTDSVGRSDEELTGRKLFNQDFAIRAVSKVLNPMRKSHHVAVADSSDLHDLHRRSIYAYIRLVKYIEPVEWGARLKAMAGLTGRGWQLCWPPSLIRSEGR